MYIKKCLQIQNNFSISTKIWFKLKCDRLGFSISLKFIVHQYLFERQKGEKNEKRPTDKCRTYSEKYDKVSSAINIQIAKY